MESVGIRPACTVYFVRHGECLSNIDEVNYPADVDMITDKGKLQASALGKALESVTFTKAYTSTFPRAVDTANGILAELKTPTPELQQDPRLRERDFGNFENRPMKDLFTALFADFDENGTKMLDFEVSGGEPVKALDARIDSFLENLFEDARVSDQPQTILVVSHGILMCRLMVKLKLWSSDSEKPVTLNGWSLWKVAVQVKNTGYHVLSIQAPSDKTENTVVDILKLQETGHLEEMNKQAEPKPPSKDYIEIAERMKGLVIDQCTTV